MRGVRMSGSSRALRGGDMSSLWATPAGPGLPVSPAMCVQAQSGGGFAWVPWSRRAAGLLGPWLESVKAAGEAAVGRSGN